jgi:hypothetical protein
LHAQQVCVFTNPLVHLKKTKKVDKDKVSSHEEEFVFLCNASKGKFPDSTTASGDCKGKLQAVAVKAVAALQAFSTWTTGEKAQVHDMYYVSQ